MLLRQQGPTPKQPTKREVKMARTKAKPTTTTEEIDPLATLLSDAVEIEKKAPGKKKDRETLELSTSETAAFDRFCAADAAMKLSKGNQETAKSVILPVLTDKLIKLWCAEGRRTDNPQIVTEQGRAIFQAREVLKFDLPADENGEPGTVTDLLMGVGFTEKEANEIRAAEFSEKTELRFCNISKLREDPANKKVVDKLLKMVIDNFTPTERAILLEKVNNVEVKEGFLDRAVTHADKDPTKLKSLFQAVKPQFLMSGITYKGDVNDAMKKLQGNEGTTVDSVPIPAPQIVPTVEFKSPDNMWKATARGTEAKLLMMQGNNEIEMFMRNCTNIDHAKATCQKWMRDPDYRAETLSKK